MRRLFFCIGFTLLLTDLAGAESTTRQSTPDPGTVKELQKCVSRAIGSYNSVDIEGLRRQFSKHAPGLLDEGAYRRLFFRYYLEDLGRVRSMDFRPVDSTFDPDRATLVYEAKFDNWPAVKISANFTRENGEPKLVQVRFEKIEN
jgi:hypothetical protein